MRCSDKIFGKSHVIGWDCAEFVMFMGPPSASVSLGWRPRSGGIFALKSMKVWSGWAPVQRKWDGGQGQSPGECQHLFLLWLLFMAQPKSHLFHEAHAASQYSSFLPLTPSSLLLKLSGEGPILFINRWIPKQPKHPSDTYWKMWWANLRTAAEVSWLST